MKKIVIILIIIAIVGAVFIGRYDNMFNTVAEIFNKYSVEAVIDGEIYELDNLNIKTIQGGLNIYVE